MPLPYVAPQFKSFRIVLCWIIFDTLLTQDAHVHLSYEKTLYASKNSLDNIKVGSYRSRYLQAEEGKHSEGEESEDDDVPEVLDGVDNGRHDRLEAGNDSHRLQSTKHSKCSQRRETVQC